mgnify:CR=1 FL=1
MQLSLSDAVRIVLSESSARLSPAQIRDRIKASHPYLYQTDAHRIGIERGNYQNFDHALLNPIYSLVTRSSDFVIDRTYKPLLVSLAAEELADEAPEENYEADQGLVYVLATGLYTQAGRRIVKIGHTTQSLDARISQLYTTGTPFQFEALHSWRTSNYTELEQALHRLFAPFRINRAREFFTDEVLAFAQTVAELHASIQAASVKSGGAQPVAPTDRLPVACR